MTEQILTLTNVVKAVCDETGIPPKVLREKRRRSTVEITAAKQLCTFFAKFYTDAKNNEINEVLGYKKGRNAHRGLRSNMEQLKNRLGNPNETELKERFDNIKLKLLNVSDRVMRVGEQLDINFRTAYNKPEDIKEYKELAAKGIYPFVIAYNHLRFYGYARDLSGSFIGQPKAQFEANL